MASGAETPARALPELLGALPARLRGTDRFGIFNASTEQTRGRTAMHARSHSSNWYDVFAFISLAAGIGLACGIVLGGIALLLSAPAYGAPLPDTGEGTLMLRASHQAEDAGGVSALQAPLVSTDVVFRVSGPI